MKTVNNLDAIPGKLSKLQKLILEKLFETKKKGMSYKDLSDEIALFTGNIIEKKSFNQVQKELKEEAIKECETLPDDKKKLTLQILQIDLRLAYYYHQNNKWRYKKFKLKDSFRASFSRTIKRLEDRNLIKTYNYFNPDYSIHYKTNYEGNYYKKYIDLTSSGLQVCKHLFHDTKNVKKE